MSLVVSVKCDCASSLPYGPDTPEIRLHDWRLIDPFWRLILKPPCYSRMTFKNLVRWQGAHASLFIPRESSLTINGTLQDRSDISDLTNGWTYRDTARWEELRGLFHTDGVIEIGWFKGLFSDFVDASIKMQATSAIHSKHFMGRPLLQISGSRAVAETNAILTGVNTYIKVGFTAHTRFFDLLEKRDGAWKLSKRNNIYDMSFLSFPVGPVPIDQEKMAQHPWEYAALAYVIEASGHPVKGVQPTRNSEFESRLRHAGARWLEER